MTLLHRNTIAVLALMLGSSGCGEAPPTAPLAATPPLDVPAPTVPRNIVHEGVIRKIQATGDPQPVPHLRLLPWDPIQIGQVGARRLPDTTTDQSGRFRIVSADNILWLEMAPGSPVKFTCPFFPHHYQPRATDVYVVDASWAGEPFWPGLWLLGIRGVVTERVGEAVRPVAGAIVTLDDGSQDPPSITSTNGFYSICSTVGADFTRTVTARKDGYRPAALTILWGWDFDVNFTLQRN